MPSAPRFRRRAPAPLLAAIVMVGAMPAWAVIKIDFPVARVYQESAVVAVGAVARLDSGNRVACELSEALKGRLPDTNLTVDAPAALAQTLKASQPVVVFIQGSRAIFHLADAWYGADSQTGGCWVINGPYPMVKNFPGRTAGLAAILRQIKAGKPGIKDGIGHEFVGHIREWGKLGVRPTFLSAADINGDGNMDLLVGTAAGCRLFLAGDAGYADVTENWGLPGAPCRRAVAGDVNGDGHPDLLLDRTLWLHAGGRFVKNRAALALPAADTWAAATLADANGDKLTDIAVLDQAGNLLMALNPGAKNDAWAVSATALWAGDHPPLAAMFAPDWGDDGKLYVLVVHPDDIVRYPVGDATAPRADFRRLTGIALSEYPKLGPLPLQVDLCTAFDYDGNGQTDLLLVTRGGGITLANRGYGALLINGFMHTQFRSVSGEKTYPKIPKLPFDLALGAWVAPGKRAGKTGQGNAQNLLILRGDGQLCEMVNER